MPRPPILPIIDWAAIFESGLSYEAWMEKAESAENRKKMEDGLRELPIEHHHQSALAGLARAVNVVAIAEDWCGDVVRHVPALQRLEQAAPKMEVRYIKREQHPDVFARFLVCGGESIPQFIFLSDGFVECGHWGPMLAGCRELIARGKAMNNVKLARERVSARYAADPQRREVIAELMALIDIAATTSI